MLKLADKPSGLGGGGNGIKLTVPILKVRFQDQDIRLTASWRFESFSYSALIG